MRYLLSLLLVLTLGGVDLAWALGPKVEAVLQNAAVATGDGTALNVDGYTAVSVDVTIANTATVAFEASGKGTAWTALACTAVNNTAGALVTTVTATGLYQCNVAGLTSFRARISSWTAGAVTVFARGTTAVFGKKGGGGGGSSLTVKENDGVPTVGTVDTISFTNGTVVDDGNGDVSVTISGVGAPTDATYITQTANATLTAEQALSTLGTGLVSNTTLTGVLSIYAGASCTNQVLRVLSPEGAGTCVTLTSAYVDSSILTSTTGATASLNNLASVAINTALLPGAAGTLDLGAATLPWREVYFAGTSATPGTNGYKLTGASTGGLRTISFLDTSYTVAGIALSQGGTNQGTWTAGRCVKVDAAGTALESAAAACGVYAIATKTTAYTATPSDRVLLCDATAGSFTITLPAVTGNDGVNFLFKKIDASANTCTIDGNGLETIDGGATAVLNLQYEAIQVVANSAGWHIF